MSKGIYHSSMKIRVLFILLLLFIFSSFTEKLMAREAEDNKTVTLTVNYNEERGIIKVNDTYVKNGEQLSIEYLSTVVITVIPNDGYCARAGDLMMTPTRTLSWVAADAGGYDTRPVEYGFKNFSEDMIFGYTFRKLLKVDVEILDDDESNGTWIGDAFLWTEKKTLFFPDMGKKLEIKFGNNSGSYLKQVLIDGVDKTSEVYDNNLQLLNFPKKILVEYRRKNGYYRIRSENEGSGYIQVNEKTAGLILASSQAVISFYPNNKELKKCLQNGVDVLAKIKDGKLVIPSVSEDILIQFGFGTPLSCYLSYNNGGEVKVNDVPIANESSIPVSIGADVQVSMFPQAGYHIKRVQLSGKDVTHLVSGNVLTFPASSANKVVTILFEKDVPVAHTVKVTYSVGGSVKVNNQSVTSDQLTTVTPSTNVKVEIMPQEGYHIKQVRLGSDDVTGQLNNNVLTIPSILSDKEISITFEKGASITYAVKVTYSTGGSVMVNDQLVASGQSVTATASADVKVMITPQDGYHIRQVKLGDEDVIDKLNNRELTIPSISADKEIKITFVKVIYTLRVTYTEGGTVWVSRGGGEYKEFVSGQSAIFKTSEIVNVSIDSKTGYRIKQVLLGNTDVTDKINTPGGREALLTLDFFSSNLEEVKDQEVAVIFEKITYSVKVTYSDGGRVQVNGQSVASGNACTADIFTDVKVMMIPDKGYRLREVNFGLMDVMNQVNNNVLTIPSISENKEITITFAYILKVYSSGNGSIKVNGEIIQSGSIIPDAGTKVEFVPNEGYYTAKVMLNSKDITSELVGNSFTVSTLPSNSSLSVTFKTLPTYELSIDMPKNEASIKIGDKVITESTRISEIKEGSSVFINFLPNKYYEIKKVTLENEDITTQIQDGFFEIKSVRSNLKLKVEYVQKKYTLSLTNSKGIEKISIYSEEFENVSSISLACGTSLVGIRVNSFYLIKQILSNGEVIYDASEENNRGSSYVELWINMDEDKELTVILELLDKRKMSLNIDEPGTLALHLSDEDMRLTTDLFIEGKIDQRDLAVINQMQSLSDLNLGWAMIEQYDGCPANTIPEKAFYHNQNIQTMYLPHSLVAIGKQAFSGSVIFSFMEDSESHKYLTKIGEEAFKDCQYLINGLAFHLTNNLVIEKGAFENCTNLNLVGLPMDLVEVKEATFRNCKNLSITLERDLERIGDYAFENVKEIYNYDWVEDGNFKLSYIGTNALKGCKNGSFYLKNYPYLKELPCFEGCSNMTFITFPPNVKDIPAGTFSGCTSLQYVTMNEKIERIAENAFSDSRMTELYVPVNKTPEVYANSFNDFTYSTAKLFVPTDQLPHYRNHPVWGKFKSIEPRGTATYRQFEVLLSKGGRVEVNKTYFGDNDFWLMANTLLFLTSSCMEVYILPDEGYSIESVRLNEENITNALDENNTYVIPYLLVDSQLEVKFKKDNTTSSEMINTDKRIYLSGTNQLSLSGFRIGAHVFVYDVNGRMITHQMISDSVEKISLPSRGIYFLLVDKESIKIVF